jgi:hypothetical protein
LLAGFGLGIGNPAIARVALGVVPPQRSGMASGISNTMRIGGLATGVAALGAIFQQRISTGLTPAFGSHAAALSKVVSSAGVQAAVVATHGQANTASIARVAFVSGLRLILVIGMILVALGAVASFALVRAKDFTHPHAAGATAVESEEPLAVAFDA